MADWLVMLERLELLSNWFVGDELAVGVADDVLLLPTELLLTLFVLPFELEEPGDVLELALFSRDDTSSSSGDCEGESEEDEDDELIDVDEWGDVDDDDVDEADDMVDDWVVVFRPYLTAADEAAAAALIWAADFCAWAWTLELLLLLLLLLLCIIE